MNSLFWRYLRIFFATLAGALAFVAAFNWWVDPYFVFRSVPDDSWTRFYSRSGTAPGKAELMNKLDYSTLFLGSSRAQDGFNPESRWLDHELTFNAGFPRGGFDEAEIALEYAFERRRLNRVLLLVDADLFGNLAIETGGFEETRFNPKLDEFSYYLRALLSQNATKYSWRVLENRMRGKQTGYTIRGWKYRLDGRDAPPRTRFDETLWSFIRPEHGNYILNQYRPQSLEPLRRIIRSCRRHDTALILAFSPIHATLIESIGVAGKWNVLEQVKRDVVQTAHDEWPSVHVWDFATFSPYTTEAISPSGEYREMNWYSEASHFNGALGELILQRIFGDGQPEDFGARIGVDSIDRHLERVRGARAAWAARDSNEADRIRAMASGIPPRDLSPIGPASNPRAAN